MKTINQIDIEIKNLLAPFEKQRTRLDKKTEKRVKFLREMRLYLQCNPKEEHVIKERDNQKRKIEIYESRFDFWRDNNKITLKGKDEKEIRAIYNEETELPTRRKQLANLNYLLS